MAIQTVVVVLLVVALLEALVIVSFRFPAASPLPLPLIRYLHMRFDRNIIQVMPECAAYDPALTYTLKPGRCTFASREFSNEYRINALGLRDDEESLVRPLTVILGDSLTMGWGVDQEQGFPSVYERLSGKRTLNAGVSSYGTVRELRMLQRIDTGALETVVIQYMENDVVENAQLIEQPPFTTLSREHYERTVSAQQELLRYFPGKYAFNVLVQLQSAIRGRRLDLEPVDVERQAELFIRVLEQSPVDLSPYRVIVLFVDSQFGSVAARRAAASGVEWVRRVEYVDASGVTAADRPGYVLDDHPTAVGHEYIARLLLEHLGGRPAQAPSTKGTREPP